MARAQCLLGAAVDHQRIGGEGQQLVEDEEGEQVARHRHPHGGGDAQAEEAEEAAAMRCAFQIADGVEGGEQPQHRRQGDEQHRQRVGLQHQVEPRQHAVAEHVLALVEHAPQHHADERELGDRADQVERGAQADARLGEEKDDQARQEGAQHHRHRKQRIVDHAALPIISSSINGAPKRPSRIDASASAKALNSSTRGTRVTRSPSATGRKARRSTLNT